MDYCRCAYVADDDTDDSFLYDDTMHGGDDEGDVDSWWGHDDASEFSGDPDVLNNGLWVSSDFAPPCSFGEAGMEPFCKNRQSTHCSHGPTPSTAGTFSNT